MSEQDDKKAKPVEQVDKKPEAAPAKPAEPAGAPKVQGPSLADQRTQRSDRRDFCPVNGGGERVTVSDDDDDDRRASPFNLLGILNDRGNERTPPPEPFPKEGETVRRSDGTEVSLREGHTITKATDGKVTDEYYNKTDGSTHTRVTYERDGAQVTETTVKAANGDTRMVSEVAKDGKIERTTSNTTLLDRPIEDIAPGLDKNLDLEHRMIDDARREKTEQTTVVREVIDTTKEPPESRKVLESTGYKQRIPVHGDDDRVQLAPPQGVNPMIAMDGYGALAGVDRGESGLTVAATKTTTYDEQGRATTTEEQGATNIIQARTKEGRDVTLSDATAVTLENGTPKERVRVTEQRGLYNKDSLDESGVDLKDEYRDRLEGDSINHRTIETQKFEGDEAKTVSKVDEFGDYDDPSKPGRVVRIREEDDRKYWEYRKVTGTDQGIHVQDQVTVEGTKAKIVTDSTVNNDGTYHTLTETFDDGVAVVREERERKRVDAAALKSADWHCDAGYRDRFLQENDGKALFEDSVLMVDTRDDPKARSYKVRNFTAEGSSDRLSHVFLSRDEGKAARSNTTILEDGDSNRAWLRGDDGLEIAMEPGKAVVDVNGKRTEVPLDGADGPNPVGLADKSKGTYTNFRNVIQNYADDVPDLPGGFKGALGGVDIVAGTVSLATAKNPGDVVSGVGNVASGLGTISEAAGKAVSSTKLSSLLGAGGKALGVVGAVGGAAYGAYQISEGDTVGGVLSMAGAAGTGLAVGASIAGVTGWVPVAGWIVAGVALVGGIGWDLWKSNEEAHHTEELTF